jgi:hypothetical protein
MRFRLSPAREDQLSTMPSRANIFLGSLVRTVWRCHARDVLAGVFLAGLGASLFAQPLSLREADTGLPIITAPAPSAIDQFAASELARYLEQISGVKFVVTTNPSIATNALLVGRKVVEQVDPSFSQLQLGDDGFVIRRLGGRVLIAGGSDTGTLYAVYSFLEKLGCRWFAPNFRFYGPATGELVPHIADPAIGNWNFIERPAFRWRKLYIEEGMSHTTENLEQMIDWMAKARMNVLDCPIDYQHQHHTEWDNWRRALAPELRKRGILIEVGGHGYPNFLPAEQYFAQHPEWFGVHEGKRTNDPRVVFSTANEDAVRTFVANVKSYVLAHPEIDILDVWPPDGAEWSEAPEDVALGSPSERQMLLLNRLARDLKPDFPKLRVQFIAYETYTTPPSLYKPAPGILMDFCPINRSFESPIYASGYAKNQEYFRDLEGWLDGAMDPNDVTIYSYITKYAWRSLPVLLPHLIVDESSRLQRMGVGGFATYSEPGNWATFELDHYITARALWSPQMDVDQELGDYTSNRYGAAGPSVRSYLALVEAVAPHAIDIPGTQLTVEKQEKMVRALAPATGLLRQAHAAAGSDPKVQILLAQLDHSDQYLQNEMEIRLELLLSAQDNGSERYLRLSDLLRAREEIISSNPND